VLLVSTEQVAKPCTVPPYYGTSSWKLSGLGGGKTPRNILHQTSVVQTYTHATYIANTRREKNCCSKVSSTGMHNLKGKINCYS